MGRLIDADAFVEDNMIPSDMPPTKFDCYGCSEDVLIKLNGKYGQSLCVVGWYDNKEKEWYANIPDRDFDVVSWMPLPDSCQKRKAREWIPCSERMPEMHKEQLEDGEYYMISDSVLATDGNSVFISDYEADDDYHFGWNHDGIKCESEITHWMPLPKPYREEGIDWPKRVDYEGEVHWN